MNYKDEDPIMNFLRETQEYEFRDSRKNEAYHIGAVFLNEKMDSPLIHGYTHFEVQEEISKLALSMNSAIDEDMLSQLIVLLKRQRCFSKLDKHLVTHFINSLVQYINVFYIFLMIMIQKVVYFYYALEYNKSFIRLMIVA